jgi:ParB family chromosome partitioning protein
MIDKLTSKRTRDTFTPTAENFFGRMKGDYLNDLWSDLLGLAADHPTVTTFEKLKKGEKALRLECLFADPATRTALGLSEDQIDRINAWLPEGMAGPDRRADTRPAPSFDRRRLLADVR